MSKKIETCESCEHLRATIKYLEVKLECYKAIIFASKIELEAMHDLYESELRRKTKESDQN